MGSEDFLCVEGVDGGVEGGGGGVGEEFLVFSKEGVEGVTVERTFSSEDLLPISTKGLGDNLRVGGEVWMFWGFGFGGGGGVVGLYRDLDS